jgi:hypothetical protein
MYRSMTGGFRESHAIIICPLDSIFLATSHSGISLGQVKGCLNQLEFKVIEIAVLSPFSNSG